MLAWTDFRREPESPEGIGIGVSITRQGRRQGPLCARGVTEKREDRNQEDHSFHVLSGI
jgi:hypothetical protein